MKSLDRIIHEPARLKLLMFLAASDSHQADFTLLRKKLELSAGNLSVQLKNLEDAGFIKSKKSFVERKSKTSILLTNSGRSALENYLSAMEEMILTMKKNNKKKNAAGG